MSVTDVFLYCRNLWKNIKDYYKSNLSVCNLFNLVRVTAISCTTLSDNLVELDGERIDIIFKKYYFKYNSKWFKSYLSFNAQATFTNERSVT